MSVPHYFPNIVILKGTGFQKQVLYVKWGSLCIEPVQTRLHIQSHLGYLQYNTKATQIFYSILFRVWRQEKQSVYVQYRYDFPFKYFNLRLVGSMNM